MVPSTQTHLVVDTLASDGASVPFGTAWLPGPRLGVDLAAAGYVEHELLVRLRARRWDYDAAWQPEPCETHDVVTRVLVRRPVDRAAASRLVLLEPLHPDLDKALTWDQTADWLLRSGHTWVGVTQSAAVASDLASRFPRYEALLIPPVGHGLALDVVGQVAVALREGALGPVEADRTLLSGWSITGSLCRLYLQEGFLARHLVAGRPAVDGVLIGKSSGAFDPAGYPALTAGGRTLAPDHPRRTVRGTVPTIEMLSETEGETHGPVLRPDGDEPGDRYRLLQVAGTSHRELRTETRLTNDHQYAVAGGEVGDARINETPSDARFELFVSAAFDQLDRWVRGESTPPHVPRFAYHPGPDGRPGALERDHDGVVVGGIRPPWLAVPTATYLPQSTPAPGALRPLARFAAPGSPEQAASMIGHRVLFDRTELDRRYGSAVEYRRRLTAAVEELVAAGLVLPEEGAAYLDRAEYPGAP